MTCSRAGARHDMRDAVPPCEMRYRGEAGTGRRNLSRRRPGRPRRLHRPTPPRPTPLTHPEATLRARSSHVTRRPPPPTHPEATRAGRHDRPPRPTALNGPSHHTRETHSDAFATALRTRRTRPSRPSPTTFTPHAFKTTPEQPSGEGGSGRRRPRRLFGGWRVGGAWGRRRVHGGALLLGPLACGWTTYVPLDHLVHEIRWSNGTQVVQPHLSGPSRPAASRHARRRPTMRDGRWGGAGAGRQNRPAARLHRPAPGS